MVPENPCIQDVLFADSVNNCGNEIALTDGVVDVGWQQLRDLSLSLALAMKNELALAPGQHIGLLIGNRPEFIEAMIAGIVAGLWITPVNTHLQPSEVSYIVNDSDAKVLFYDSVHEHLISAINQEHCRCINIEVFCQQIDQSLRNGTGKNLDTAFPLSGPAGGTMLYTSGTTGKPKGVKRNKPNSLGEALQRMQSGGAMFGLVGAGPHLVTGPLYHAAPMLFALYDLLNGAPMVIMPKWDNKTFVDFVSKYSVVTTHLVPTMFVRLLNDKAALAGSFSSLTLVLHGAAPIAKSTKQKMLNWWGPILVEYWGGTEAGVTTLVTSEQWLQHPGTVGKPLSHFDVYVGDEKGESIANKDASNKDESKKGESKKESSPVEGLLFCRHHQLSQVFEYHRDNQKTRESHPKPFVFCIGDIGYVKDGFVYLSDRKSNMIISGGVNIYPVETEQALIEHDAVADVAVFGVPSEEWGEEVKAAIQLTPGFTATDELAAELIQFSREKVATYKAPKSIDFEAQLPRTPTGKLLVRLLKEKYQ